MDIAISITSTCATVGVTTWADVVGTTMFEQESISLQKR